VKKRITVIFLLSMTAVSLYLCYILFSPFLKPLLSATVIAIVFFPVHEKIQRFVRNPSLAAFASSVSVALLIVVPAVAIILAIKEEVAELYALIDQKSTESGGLSPFLSHLVDRPMQWIGRYIDLSQFDLRASLLGRLRELGAFLVAEGWMLVGSVTTFVVNSIITLFTLFFLFREGRSLRRRAAAIVPLSNDQIVKLFSGIENTIIGTVYGGLAVAAVQGAMVGLALWILGVPSPVLWGVVASFLALLPLVGTAAVWVPASIYLLASGSWPKAVILAAWGIFAVGLIDNILRPYLISGRVQMHTLLIFFSVFGGVNVFGFLGLFIGPVIIAVTITLLGLLRDEGRAWSGYWNQATVNSTVAAPGLPVTGAESPNSGSIAPVADPDSAPPGQV
jgi:predicted PurR-regulated permease PerM